LGFLKLTHFQKVPKVDLDDAFVVSGNLKGIKGHYIFWEIILNGKEIAEFPIYRGFIF